MMSDTCWCFRFWLQTKGATQLLTKSLCSFSSCPPSRSHDVKIPAPFLCVWQDNKAMNMFGMDHMLKDGWNGWYSQGYMYFDNCSSLFLPKVWVRRLVSRREVCPQCPVNLTSSHLSPRFTTQTSTPISPSAAPRSVTAPPLTDQAFNWKTYLYL